VDTFTNISKILQRVFALGVAYGRAIHEGDIEATFEQKDEQTSSNISELEIAKMNNMLKSLMPYVSAEQYKAIFKDISLPNEEEDDEGYGQQPGEESP
jgi:hypothetical protein